jgi:general secretion pathway protein A
VYLSFFNLREQPFNLTPDPRFLFLSPQHEEALSHFLYGIYERKGFIEITGEVGTGKTILCRELLDRLDENVSTALIFNSYLNEIELLQAILSDLGLTCTENSRKAHIDMLNHYLLQECAAGRNAVVVVDEAQNLEPMVLEQLRMLSNLETDSGKLLQIVLVGQPELRDKLSTPQMRQLDQRIAVRFHLHGLHRATTQQYVMHRLSVAGSANSVTFTRQAWRLIHRYCGGLPRRINLLCDRILMTAYVRSTHRISAKIVRQSWRDLTGSRRPVAVSQPRLVQLLTLVCGGLLGLGVFTVLTSGSLFPGARDHLKPVLPEPIQALTQYLAPSPPQPQRSLTPVAPPPSLPAPQPPQSPMSIEINLPLAQQLWQVKTQAEDILLQGRITQPVDREAIVIRTANAMGFDTLAVPANLAQLSRFSRPCLIEVVSEPNAPQPVLWLLARGVDDSVLVYEPTGLTSVPLPLLHDIKYGKIYLVLEKGKYQGPTLRQGMQGARVHMLQQVLHTLGYFTGSLSGQFDAQTLDAVKAFQQDNRLVVDGYVGRQTLTLLLYLGGRVMTETT